METQALGATNRSIRCKSAPGPASPRKVVMDNLTEDIVVHFKSGTSQIFTDVDSVWIMDSCVLRVELVKDEELICYNLDIVSHWEEKCTERLKVIPDVER